MNARPRSMVTAFATFVILTTVGSATAVSDVVTIPYTKALVSTFNPTESVTPIVTHNTPAIASAVTYDQAGSWGSVSGFASADLSTGQLKVRAADAPLVGYSPYMQVNA